jgi:thiamine biosynthesis lipoprotein
MGCDVVVGGASRSEFGAVEAIFAERERRFSRFDPSSELSSVNRSRSGLVTVSAAFAEMLELALQAAVDTEGMVVPTLGRAIALAGYDRDFAEVADDEPATSGEQRGDAHPTDVDRWRQIRVRGCIVHRPPGLVLDLNGVVKGRTVDDALGLLGSDCFVSAGGDLAVSGAIDVGLPGGDAIRVVSGGLATSSTGRRRWRRDGSWQHHLIDPRTSLPSDSPWSDVSVSASSCRAADVAAKAALLRGGEGPGWLDVLGLAGRFRRPSGEVVLTESWPVGTGVMQRL